MPRSRGEGSITQRKDGRWQASLQVDGRRRTVYGKTRKEVADKLTELKSQAAMSGLIPRPGKRTLNDLLDAWLETKSPGWKPLTAHDYSTICSRCLRPTLGKAPLSRVTPDRIARFVGAWQRRGKARTALKLYRVLSQALDLAVKWGWLASNPCRRVDTPRYRPQRKEMWSPHELSVFLEGAKGHWLYPLWILALTTGARLGELLALEWPDVNLTASTISISKSRQRLGGEWVISSPKTPASRRTVALPTEAVRALAGQAERRLSQGGGLIVFTGEKGAPLNPSVASHALRQECRRLGIRPLTMHGLRHLHASLLLNEGLPVPEVAARLGHSTPQVTMGVYAHALQGGDRRAAQALERLLEWEEGGRACDPICSDPNIVGRQAGQGTF
ncbi:MAG: site-specific integrase [Chloroflexi bacterium]|nr:site-specific integrase [Chloroflexota bacterium]